MPRISAEHKQLYKSKIRGVLSQNPQITQRELQMRLEQDGIRLDRKYLGQLLKSVYTERIKRADTWTLNTALAAFQDAMAEIARAGWEIINDPMARNMDKALAMREVREAYSVVFEKLFDAGVFERKRGSIDLMIRNTPLHEERKQAIRSVFENWGLLEAPKEDAGTNSNPAG